MLRIGICDDQPDARFSLRCALERAAERRKIELSFWEFSAGERLLNWLENHTGELDMIFLDMEMGQLDGMETARRLRRQDEMVQIVFVTAYADHVFDGYSVGALGYLLKPAKAEALEDILLRASAALCRQADQHFLCRNGDSCCRIPLGKILYFYSDRRRVICVCQGKEYPFYGKLDQVEQELGGDFVRIHQRYLVRAGAVDRFGSGEVQIGQTVLPISRSCQNSAMLALARTMAEG